MGILELLFIANCGISIVAYIPQIAKLLKDKTDSASVSIGSWLIWVYTSCIALAYAVFINGDALIILSSGIAVFFCSLVVGLLIFNKTFKFRLAGRDNISILDMFKGADQDEQAPEAIYELAE